MNPVVKMALAFYLRIPTERAAELVKKLEAVGLTGGLDNKFPFGVLLSTPGVGMIGVRRFAEFIRNKGGYVVI